MIRHGICRLLANDIALATRTIITSRRIGTHVFFLPGCDQCYLELEFQVYVRVRRLIILLLLLLLLLLRKYELKFIIRIFN